MAQRITLPPVRVKRDGPRGWHWIAAEHYDPSVHEIYEPEEVSAEAEGADDGEGLTKVEIIADLEAMQIECDPRAKKADLLALRNEGRAKRDAETAGA